MAEAWELETVIKQAIDMELRIKNFYLESVPKVKSDMAREALQFLAEQESKHIEDIEAFAAEHAGETPHIDLSERLQEIAKEKIKKFFLQRKQYFEKNVQAYPEDAAIYKMGLEIEKNGYKFYEEQEQAATDDKAREFFAFLKNEEIAHYELVDQLSTYLLKPGLWFLEQEKWMFDGA